MVDLNIVSRQLRATSLELTDIESRPRSCRRLTAGFHLSRRARTLPADSSARSSTCLVYYQAVTPTCDGSRCINSGPTIITLS